MKSKLHEAFNPESFRKLGHELIDLLTTHLHDAGAGRKKVINWKEPATQLAFWQQNLAQEQSLTDLFKDVLDNSISIHHPQYIGHQVGPTMPVAALADLLGALTNNGMAVYEMGAAGTAIEKVVIDLINKQIGYGPDADGFMTSGGTLANLTALLAARKAMAGTDIWQEGHKEKLAVMVSGEAHYCIDRSLRIMGFGSEGIIKIPVNNQFSIDATLLEKYYEDAVSRGIKVIAVVGCAPSTATGMHDDLLAIGRFCRKHRLWFHVDAAHGGAAIFTVKYRNLVNGIEMADSVVIDGHKMMMAPALTTFLLFKNKKHSHANFNQSAIYLWEKQDEEEWYNYARRTFECTKLMMSLKLYVMIKSYGTSIFDEFVTRQYDLAKVFATSIHKRPDFELFIEPDSNIVCFRFIKKELDESTLSKLNASIRRSLLEQGDFYIVQTLLNHKTWLRVTIMSPFTTSENFEQLLNRIELQANQEIKSLIS